MGLLQVCHLFFLCMCIFLQFDACLCAHDFVAYLNSQAMAQISESVTVLPNLCQQNLKKVVCASVYLKCLPNVNLSNVATWDFSLYPSVPIPVPFQRPCLDMCMEVATSCLGIPELSGSGLNCSGVFDYTYGAFGAPVTPLPKMFDYSNNNATTCNRIYKPVSIQTGKEPYISNGVCAGYTYELFVPPSNSPGLPFAPLGPPYLVQSSIETLLQDPPLWVTAECSVAFRKYFCGTYYNGVTTTNLGIILTENGYPAAAVSAGLDAQGLNGTAILNNPMYLPNFPERQICVDYSTKCAAFIKAVGDNNPGAVPHCDAIDPVDGYQLYPEHSTQTIANMTMAGMFLKINSSANTMAYVDVDAQVAAVTPQCPGGWSQYVEGDGSTDPAEGTACAMNCITPLFTEKERDDRHKSMFTFLLLGIVFATITFIIHFKYRDTCDEAMLLMYLVFSIIQALFDIMMYTIPEEEDRFCRNETTVISNKGSFTYCAFINLVDVYFLMGMSLIIMFEGVNFFSMKVLGHPKVDWSKKKTQMVIAATVPIIAVVATIAGGYYGYSLHGFACFYNEGSGDADMIIFFIPVFTFLVVTFVCMLTVLIRLVMVASGSSSLYDEEVYQRKIDGEVAPKEAVTHLKKLSLHFVFALFTSILGIMACIVRFRGKRQYHEMTTKFEEWAVCLFLNFDGTAASYETACPSHSDPRPSLGSLDFALAVKYAAGFFCALIFLPSTIRTFVKCVIYGESVTIDRNSSSIAPAPAGKAEPQVVAVELAKTDANL